jgi:septal ring factor EnvC (AmiA/AmiB activator)
MWKEIIEFGKDLLLLTRETQQNKSDIKRCEDKIVSLEREIDDIRADFNKLVHLVHQLSYDIEKVGEREKNEREKIALQLENEMLKFERRLPQGKNE